MAGIVGNRGRQDIAILTHGHFDLTIKHGDVRGVSPIGGDHAAAVGHHGQAPETAILMVDHQCQRTIHLAVADEVLAHRRAAQEIKGWHPVEDRPRRVSAALQAYAAMTTSAARGAVRDVSQLGVK